MKTVYILRMILFAGFIHIVTSYNVFAEVGVVGAETESEATDSNIIEPLVLRKIMSDLGEDM